MNGKATAALGVVLLGLSSWTLLQSVGHGKDIAELRRDRSDVDRLERRVESLETEVRQNHEWILDRTRDRFTASDFRVFRAELEARLFAAGVK